MKVTARIFRAEEGLGVDELNIDNYMKNPIVHKDFNFSGEPIIGKVISLYWDDNNEYLMAEMEILLPDPIALSLTPSIGYKVESVALGNDLMAISLNVQRNTEENIKSIREQLK